ncbi:MAG: sulfite exporter TauE/SafE family protein [Desulfosarcina sp.]|nr:sulfite exporter TauE/SafE family protein [Desulfosarcina sp.]MBC2767315.1 sulfite exporter TauE/SafE family protein [Desulfosarcina sp.]
MIDTFAGAGGLQLTAMGILTLAYLGIAILSAGIIRGYSGFGFSMIAVMSVTLVLPPSEVVPIILMLEVVASLWLLPRVWRQVDWKSLVWLSAGVLVGTPVGVYLLANIPPRPMRAAIAVVVMVMVVLLWTGFALKQMPGRGKTVVVGALSGVLNGSATIGGPPVILFYLSSPASIAVSRASLIAFFLGTDIVAFLLCLQQGLVTTKTAIMGRAIWV